MVGLSRLHETIGMPRNHAVLVGWHDTDGHGAALYRDDRRVRRVARSIDSDAEKIQTRADALAYLNGPFADAAGKHQRLHSAEYGGEGAQILARLIAKER